MEAERKAEDMSRNRAIREHIIANSGELISEIKRPPMGIKPKYLHDEHRRDEIKAAILRYMQANRKIPVEWIKEYNQLLDE